MRKIFNIFSPGDTMIEVLVAVTVFSLLAVGGIAVMNQGAATAQRSLEITLVREEVDAQAEALRYINSAYIAEYEKGKDTSSYDDQSKVWLAISNAATDSATSFGLSSGQACSDIIPTETGFVINTQNLELQPINGISADQHSATYSKINYDDTDTSKIDSIDGLWVEAVKGAKSDGSLGYIDFHIRACWDSVGQDVPQTIGTIVRLYEPRG